MKKRKPPGYWTIDRSLKEAKKYKNKTDFSIKRYQAYRVILSNSLSDIAFKHMNSKIKRKRGYWKKKTIKEVSIKFTNKRDFSRKYPGAYRASIKLGILEEVCSHMEELCNFKNRKLYSFEFSDNSVYIGLTCNYERRYHEHMSKSKEIIKKTEKLGHEFIMFNDIYPVEEIGAEESKLIEFYRDEGWKILNKVSGGSIGSPRNRKWKREEIFKVSKKYKKRSKFKKEFGGAYAAAKKMGILDEVLANMKPNFKKNKWDKDSVIKAANNCSSPGEFHKKYNGAYRESKRLGLFKYIANLYK